MSNGEGLMLATLGRNDGRYTETDLLRAYRMGYASASGPSDHGAMSGTVPHHPELPSAHIDRLTTAEAADYLPMPVETLRWRRKQGMAPRSFKIGRRIFYERADLDAFLAEQRETTGVGGP